MIVKVQVVSERQDSYMGKRGKVEQTILACLDLTPEGAMVNTFDYILTEEERARLQGTLQGKKLHLVLIDIGPVFGGRLRFRGSILESAPTTTKA
jgi:hypothetical protein